MPDPTPRLDSLGSLADQRRLSAPRMMSGQFPDEILDPAIRELGWRFGVVPDREALRGGLEQEVGFADYGKYSREQIIEGLRLLEKEGFHIKMPDGARLSPADLAEHVRRSFPEPGPQSGLFQAPRSSLAAAYAAPTLPTDAAPEPLLRPCPRPFPRGCTRWWTDPMGIGPPW